MALTSPNIEKKITQENLGRKPTNFPERIASIIYHGSSKKFECPKCCPSERVNHEGQTIWKGEAVFATFDRLGIY